MSSPTTPLTEEKIRELESAIASNRSIGVHLVQVRIPILESLLAAAKENRELRAERDTNARSSVELEALAEQQHGRTKYGNGPDDFAHDDAHSLADWMRFIFDHAGRAADNAPLESRQHLVKIQGLAKSAIESFDRKSSWAVLASTPAKAEQMKEDSNGNV